MVGGVDLQRLIPQLPAQGNTEAARNAAMTLRQSGFADMQYAVWQYKHVSGRPLATAELSFTGPRRGIRHAAVRTRN